MIFPQIALSRFGRKGARPNANPLTSPGSKLHNTASVNNVPSLNTLPFFFQRNLKPSNLDLQGKKPVTYLTGPNKPK